jgi:hypothetical protein
MAAKTKFGYSWAAYRSIEEDMLRVAEDIPLETRQYNVYSFKLADIIVRSCSHIDSLFKDILRNQDLSSHPNQQKIAESRAILTGKERGMLTIKDYIEIFADYLNLASVEVIIRRNGEQRSPFERFKEPKPDDKIPPWWDAYNALKHDFYSEVEEGNLGNALESLAALFVLNCKIPFNFKLEKDINYLVSNGAITSPNFIHKGQLLEYIQKDPELTKYSLVATTDLFEYWLSYNKKTIGLTSITELDVPRVLRIPGERHPGI